MLSVLNFAESRGVEGEATLSHTILGSAGGAGQIWCDTWSSSGTHT